MIAVAIWRIQEQRDDCWINKIKGFFLTNPKDAAIDGFGIVRFPKRGLDRDRIAHLALEPGEAVTPACCVTHSRPAQFRQSLNQASSQRLVSSTLRVALQHQYCRWLNLRNTLTAAAFALLLT